ncbi:hypothetical protein AUJ62_00680 [Candidatus Pacearchaeota archaeon CG1_02_32_21]|nr:MAG: hypothetical protein AUJ62_00680 [Candidatus Pacearchaeota archaeon CG1_02_32_21]
MRQYHIRNITENNEPRKYLIKLPSIDYQSGLWGVDPNQAITFNKREGKKEINHLAKRHNLDTRIEKC